MLSEARTGEAQSPLQLEEEEEDIEEEAVVEELNALL